MRENNNGISKWKRNILQNVLHNISTFYDILFTYV